MVTKTVFITHQCFSSCCTAWRLAPSVALPQTARRLGMHKKLGGDGAGTADPN